MSTSTFPATLMRMFTLANFRQLLPLILTPLVFFFTLPFLLAYRVIKYYLMGGKEHAAKLAEKLPSLNSARLEKLSQDAGLPAHKAVSTTTRMAPHKGPQGFDSMIVENDGVKLHVAIGGDFASSKPRLLFLHGFPENWSTWSHQLVYFARLGFAVAAMDLRGHGASDAPAETSAYRMRVLVSDVLAVIRKLSENGTHKIVLIGHDWGGVVAQNVGFLGDSNSDSASVSKFVIMNAPHPAHFQTYALKLDRFQLLRSWYMLFFNVPVISEAFLNLDPKATAKMTRSSKYFNETDIELAASIVADWAKCRGMLNYYRAAVSELLYKSANHPIKPAPILKPVLNCWGGADEAIGVDAITTLPLHKWLPHAQSRIQLLNGTHWIQNEKPKEVAEAILKFVQES